ncbi:protein SSUH2 homolog isoform X2 [Dendropsophus ebraccatus]|uniref:protein SSUH2 homolog isoform X2 n=1 Tax=Dendropsophus ebraccatus TaxID=150705 RepID=UPI003831CC21
MSLTPSRTKSGFVDIDLSTPKSSSEIVLVHQAMGTPVGLSSSNAPPGSQGCTVPTLVLTSSSGKEQLHLSSSRGTNSTVINGNPSTVPSFHQPVVRNSSLNPQVPTISDTTLTTQHRSTVDVQVVVTQNCSGASSPGNVAAADGGKCLPPPPGQTSMSATTSSPTNTDHRALLITEAAAKQAFQEYGQSKFFYRGTPAKEMVSEELRPLNTYRYSLETFTESRTCEWVTETYTGQHVDSTNVRSTIQPWEIPIAVPEMFKDGTQQMKLPNTSSVKACSHCKGIGKNMCLKCHGTGRIQCMWCNGTGRRMQMEMCQQCYGSGTESCRMCINTTAQNCVTCGGKGQILTYVQLNIMWKNNKYQFISEHNSEFSSDLFTTVHGERIFTDEQLSVRYPDRYIIWGFRHC